MYEDRSASSQTGAKKKRKQHMSGEEAIQPEQTSEQVELSQEIAQDQEEEDEGWMTVRKGGSRGESRRNSVRT